MGHDESKQADKFRHAAREVEADESEEAFDRQLKQVVGGRAIVHASDCAVHNAPAYEPGPCDCGATKAPQ